MWKKVLIGFLILMAVGYGGVGIVYLLNKEEVDTAMAEQKKENAMYEQAQKEKRRCKLAMCEVERKLKEVLRDPDSYERINYSSELNKEDSCYIVTIRYRAKNGFGGYNVSAIEAEVIYSEDTPIVSRVREL